MNILVTGGLGVNGVWVVRQLVEEGYRPIIYDNRTDTTLIADIEEKVGTIVGDVLDIAHIIRVLKQYDIKRIIHLAGVMTDGCQQNPVVGFDVNAVGTVNVLEAARIMEVERVVFTSSKGALAPCLGEYGYPTYKLVDETYPAYPASPTTVYGATKVASELMGNAYSELYGFEFITLRFATIYGPGKSVRHGTRAIYGEMIENAMSGKPTVIPQGGEEKNDILYVKDCASSIVMACFAKSVESRLFHIGNGRGYLLQDVADSIKKMYPDAVFSIGPGLRKVRGLACIMDISRAKKELGYAPAYDLDAGVRDYVDVMKQFNL